LCAPDLSNRTLLGAGVVFAASTFGSCDFRRVRESAYGFRNRRSSGVLRLMDEVKANRSLGGENGRMRKRIVGPRYTQPERESDQDWLDLGQIATVEVTSEDADCPIEGAFESRDGRGWRAAGPGEQQIRIIFDEPVWLHRIELRFYEPESERTQEFILRWCSAPGGVPAEIVRQQWNFSPAGSTTEVETYGVDLQAVSILELVLLPDLRPECAVATLASWRLG
jgi:hypothetical protein